MKTFDVASRTAEEGGEHVLGARQTGTHACYMIYGRLKPGEGGRLINPGDGHEEIILSVKGDLGVSGHLTGTLKEGSAFHVAGNVSCYLRNLSEEEAVYVAAGGHSESGRH
jgi:hypothetical protein